MISSYAKTITLVFAVWTCAFSLAATSADIVGKWEMPITLPDRSINIVLSFDQSSDGLIGSWSDPQGVIELSDVTFNGTRLAFSRPGPEGDQQMALKYENGVLTATLEAPDGEILITATKVGTL